MRAAQRIELRVRQGRRTRIIPSVDEDEADAVRRREREHWAKDAYGCACERETSYSEITRQVRQSLAHHCGNPSRAPSRVWCTIHTRAQNPHKKSTECRC